MVVAVVAANVVHHTTVLFISLFHSGVPVRVLVGSTNLGIAPDGSNLQGQTSERNRSYRPRQTSALAYHEIVNTNRIWPCKVVDPPLAVANTHMSNAGAAAGQRTERPPHNGVRIALSGYVDFGWATVHERRLRSIHTMPQIQCRALSKKRHKFREGLFGW